jgi:hypothetical protein
MTGTRKKEQTEAGGRRDEAASVRTSQSQGQLCVKWCGQSQKREIEKQRRKGKERRSVLPDEKENRERGAQQKTGEVR